MEDVRARNASAWLIPNDGTRTNHQLRRDMRRFDEDDEVDLVVVGCGAGGSVLTQRLARQGWRIVTLDAGPFWDPDRDWVSDERGSHHLYWTEPRVIAGDDPVALGANNSGRGVGGSMVHFAGYAPRFHPSDFHTRSTDGVGADWPIRYEDLRPYYEHLEAELPGRRRAVAVGRPARLPAAPAPGRRQRPGVPGRMPRDRDRRACRAGGDRQRADGQPSALHLPGVLPPGLQGQREGLAPHHPRAGRTGARRRDPRRLHGQPGARRCRSPRPSGVTYFRDGVERRQRARMVAVAGYSIETPRLLLNSACATFPDGLCNDHDLVGRYVMVQGAPQTAGRYPEEVRPYKAPPPEVSTEAFYETDPTKDYQRGYLDPVCVTAADHVRGTRRCAGTLGWRAP